jgi:hypothetical protein
MTKSLLLEKDPVLAKIVNGLIKEFKPVRLERRKTVVTTICHGNPNGTESSSKCISSNSCAN